MEATLGSEHLITDYLDGFRAAPSGINTSPSVVLSKSSINSCPVIEGVDDHAEDYVDDDEEEDITRQYEGVEEELDWLRRTGYDFLLCCDEPGAGDSDGVEWDALQSLSQRQAAVVKRRVLTIRDTLRRKRVRDRSRKLDVRHVFAAATPPPPPLIAAASGGATSRSDTPDSLNSLDRSPPPPSVLSTPSCDNYDAVDICGALATHTTQQRRLASGSPGSQGYHSSSRGSLDQLADSSDEAVSGGVGDGLGYRHVLRISLDSLAKNSPGDVTDGGEKWRNKWRPSLCEHRACHITPPVRLQRRCLSGDQLDCRSPNELSAPAGVCASTNSSLGGAKVHTNTPLSDAHHIQLPRVRANHRHHDQTHNHNHIADTPNLSPVPTLNNSKHQSKHEYCLPSSSAVNAAIHAVSCVDDTRLGLTWLDHLSEADAGRVQRLALLELTGLYDEHQISVPFGCGGDEAGGGRIRRLRRVSRRQRLRSAVHASSPDTGECGENSPDPATSAEFPPARVFGATLASLLHHDRQLAASSPSASVGAALATAAGSGCTYRVPLLLEVLLGELERRGLLEPGVLRVPGNQQHVERLRRALDADLYVQPTRALAAVAAAAVNDLAALVKQFVRRLPAPLLTGSLTHAFCSVYRLPDADTRRQALQLLSLQLPLANRHVLARVLHFLARLASHEATNRMSAQNIAVVMAPNLLPPDATSLASSTASRDIHTEVAFARAAADVVRQLMDDRSQLWRVPAMFVRQIRDQHERERCERVRKQSNKNGRIRLLRWQRRAVGGGASAAIVRKIDNEVDYQEGVLRMWAPQFNRTAWPVQLTSGTVAGHLVSRCIQESLLMPELYRRVHGRREPRRSELHRRKQSAPSCHLVAADANTLLQCHFLYEEGGNIDERKLEHSACMLACYQENPNARWVVRCCHGEHQPSSRQR